MAVISSVQINGLECLTPGTYGVGNETLYALYAASPEESVSVDMAGRHPHMVRRQPLARSLEFILMLEASTGTQRQADYMTFQAACRAGDPLTTLSWNDGSTYTYLFHATNIIASAWFTRAVASLYIPNPDRTD